MPYISKAKKHGPYRNPYLKFMAEHRVQGWSMEAVAAAWRDSKSSGKTIEATDMNAKHRYEQSHGNVSKQMTEVKRRNPKLSLRQVAALVKTSRNKKAIELSQSQPQQKSH